MPSQRPTRSTLGCETIFKVADDFSKVAVAHEGPVRLLIPTQVGLTGYIIAELVDVAKNLGLHVMVVAPKVLHVSRKELFGEEVTIFSPEKITSMFRRGEALPLYDCVIVDDLGTLGHMGVKALLADAEVKVVAVLSPVVRTQALVNGILAPGFKTLRIVHLDHATSSGIRVMQEARPV